MDKGVSEGLSEVSFTDQGATKSVSDDVADSGVAEGWRRSCLSIEGRAGRCA